MKDKLQKELEKRIQKTLEDYAIGIDESPSKGFDILRWARRGLLKVK